MNIFVLDRNIRKCAQYHCDQHVVKMTLESVQILCTVLNERGVKTAYKSTHPKHPCVLWAAASSDNFLWLRELAMELNREYRYRYTKTCDHGAIAAFPDTSAGTWSHSGLTDFVQVMPEEYRYKNNPVRAYRAFYRGQKAAFARWTKRPPPVWMMSVLNNS